MKTADLLNESFAKQHSELTADWQAMQGRQNWFAKLVLQHGLLPLLNYAPPNELAETMQKLFYAYQTAGSRLSALYAGEAVFGAGSTVIVNEEAGSVQIGITGGRADQYFALAADKDFAVCADEEGPYALYAFDPSHVLGDLYGFFKLFLRPEIELVSIDISAGDPAKRLKIAAKKDRKRGNKK